MAVTKKIIGRLPVFYGSYYPKEGGWAMKNRVTLFGSEFESKIENNTYAPATYDEITNTVTFNTDYWDVVSNGTDAWLASDKIEALGYYVENPEWMRVLVDADGRILAGIKTDGSVEWSVGVPTPVKEYITEHLAEIMADVTEDLDTKVDKEEGKSLVDSEFAGGISYVENPEFTAVYLDKDERILFGVHNDGNFYFGCGVPKQITEYVEDKFKGVTAEDIKISLESDTTIMQYLNDTYGEYIENPEWLEVKIDTDGRIIRGTKLDGTTFIGKLSSPETDKIVHDMNNLDYYNVTKRNIGTVEITVYSAAGGWEQVAYDSTAYPYDESDTYNVGEVCNVSEDTAHSYKATARNKGIYPCVAGKETVVAEKLTLETALAAIDSNIKATFTAGQIIVFLDTDDIIEKWELQDDNTWERISPHEVSDPEGRHEITTDNEHRIISYRKPDGIKVENVGFESPRIATDSLNLSESGMTEFQQALKDSGFRPGGGGDWTDREVIELPEPASYALLNLIVDSLPVQDDDVSEGYAEYYDKGGNYFKLSCSLETQGQSSRRFAKGGSKGNYTLDLEKDIKFGDWVPQDSFHLKGTPKDVTHGMLATSYKWAYMFMEYLYAKPNRVLLKDNSETTTTNASGDRFTDWGDGARCLPDGFPCEIYVNGEYWGLYALQLKKHRKNYSMDKKDYTSFFIDPEAIMTSDYEHGIWNDGVDDTIYRPLTWWRYFDIKGPKDLICMDGSEFDGDSPKELIDSTSEYYDDSNKKHKGSATTKAIIRSFSTKYLEVKALIEANDIEAAKVKFNENFDYNSCMLVFLFNTFMRNSDSIKKNTLWGTYNNGKIFALLWDLDGVYGTDWTGTTVGSPGDGVFATYTTAEWPLKLLWELYESEIKDAYSNLRATKIISVDTWRNIVINKWINRIGEEAYNRDIEKWPETPSYRQNYTNTDYWTQGKLRDSSFVAPEWDETVNYNVNDICKIRMHSSVPYWMTYRAKVDNVGVCPVTKFYDAFPVVGGYFESPARMQKWITEQIRICDNFMGYTE